MCECDCLIQFLNVSSKVKEIENHLDKTIKQTAHISLNEFNVLYYLSQEPQKSMRINDLQEKINMTQSAMSRLVARLEQTDLDYIQRKPCSKDKRGVCVMLTPKGHDMLNANIHFVETVLEQYHSIIAQF